MDRLTELKLFVQTAELGTLSKAAEALEISVAAASRHLSALESRLHVRLIDRTTRRLALTSPGNDFYGRCKAVLAELQDAEASVNAAQTEPVGSLTIAASISFSKLHIAPLIPGFISRYPRIKVKLLGENRYFDILNSDVDMAIRTREFEPDSNITIRRLAESRRVLAAAPAYLARAGVPQSVESLANHRLLVYSYANTPMNLSFTRADETRSMRIEPAVESNDGQILTAVALAAGGILVQPRYVIQNALDDGRLVPVLPDWELPRLTINIAFQDRRNLSIKTRLFIDYLVDHFQAQGFEQRWVR